MVQNVSCSAHLGLGRQDEADHGSAVPPGALHGLDQLRAQRTECGGQRLCRAVHHRPLQAPGLQARSCTSAYSCARSTDAAGNAGTPLIIPRAAPLSKPSRAATAPCQALCFARSTLTLLTFQISTCTSRSTQSGPQCEPQALRQARQLPNRHHGGCTHQPPTPPRPALPNIHTCWSASVCDILLCCRSSAGKRRTPVLGRAVHAPCHSAPRQPAGRPPQAVLNRRHLPCQPALLCTTHTPAGRCHADSQPQWVLVGGGRGAQRSSMACMTTSATAGATPEHLT